tara:strand:+ start:3026 stop:3298 length:273 start_codon:yes stop_codon:yes gene_type:complete
VTTAELTTIGMKLGLKADQMELTMEFDPESVPDGRNEEYKEHYTLLRAADVAISTLLEQREDVKRALWSTQRELKFKTSMINDIINKNYG